MDCLSVMEGGYFGWVGEGLCGIMTLLSGFQSLKPTSQYVSFSSLYNEIRQHQIFQISVIYLFIYFLIYIYIYIK